METEDIDMSEKKTEDFVSDFFFRYSTINQHVQVSTEEILFVVTLPEF